MLPISHGLKTPWLMVVRRDREILEPYFDPQALFPILDATSVAHPSFLSSSPFRRNLTVSRSCLRINSTF